MYINVHLLQEYLLLPVILLLKKFLLIFQLKLFYAQYKNL